MENSAALFFSGVGQGRDLLNSLDKGLSSSLAYLEWAQKAEKVREGLVAG